MKAWGITDTGLVRRDNQDIFAIASGALEGDVVALVCDGMGGASSGLLASSLAVSTFLEQIGTVANAEMSIPQLREASSYCVAQANRAVYDRAQSSEADRGMGTTLVAAVTSGDDVVICNVGDSRAYHLGNSGVSRITRDHSVVEGLIESGDITAEQARSHPNRNLITRALGPDADAQCDGYICPMKAGEFLLLCTDGLVDTVSDQEMLFEILHGDSTETCLDRLLSISKQHGAPDNVTAVLVQIL